MASGVFDGELMVKYLGILKTPGNTTSIHPHVVSIVAHCRWLSRVSMIICTNSSLTSACYDIMNQHEVMSTNQIVLVVSHL